jgi:GntR family transcriptional regulator
MAREQVAGAIILGKLRERIISGLYLGYWRPGERLPSIREIAEAEHVDRKTAAAAYRRLQEEGLVRVRARSGVYLCAPILPEPSGPLDRLHRQWLEHTYEGARALGLDTRTILRLINTVAEIERLPLPVVECNWAQAEALAAELRERLDVHAVPCVLDELRSGEPVLADAPALVTTPYHGADLALLAPGRVIIEATLAPSLLRELRERLALGRVLIVVEAPVLEQKVRRAFDHCDFGSAAGENLQLIAATDRAELLAAARNAKTVFLWPGTPQWVDDALLPNVERIRPRRMISDDSLTRVQIAILDSALRRAKSGLKMQEARAV